MMRWVWLVQLHFANKKLKEATDVLDRAQPGTDSMVKLVRWGLAHLRVSELLKKIERR